MNCRYDREAGQYMRADGEGCGHDHCRVCNRRHVEGFAACAECLATTRSALRGIGIMCGALPEEVEHRGIEGEAMMLLGPAADPEARGHLEASVAAGRVPTDYLEAADNELHPLFVLGSWDMVVRDALEHDEPTDRLTVESAIGYLDRQLTYLAGFEHLPFEDMSREIRACELHLESVLHDGEQRETGAPCMECRVPLVREWGHLAAADGWRCPRCREWRSDQDYRLNVAELHRGSAEWLTDRDMEIRTGVKAGTVRVWANRDLVQRKRDSGRTLYAVADVENEAKGRGLLSA